MLITKILLGESLGAWKRVMTGHHEMASDDEGGAVCPRFPPVTHCDSHLPETCYTQKLEQKWGLGGGVQANTHLGCPPTVPLANGLTAQSGSQLLLTSLRQSLGVLERHRFGF